MNKVELTGRLTRDPDVRQSETQGGEKITIARYTLAVDRKGLKNHDNAPSADFVPCVAFGRAGDFASKYLTQGIKIGIVGHIQTGFYINKEGKKIYTVEVAVEEHEFEEPKKSSGGAEKIEAECVPVEEQGSEEKTEEAASDPYAEDEGFMSIPQEVYDNLPYRN